MQSSTKRLQILQNHLVQNPTYNAGKVVPISDDDVVIVAYARTAMTKAGKGAQKDTNTEEMLVPVFQSVIQQTKIDPKLIEDVCIGSVLQNGAGANQTRMGMFLAGIPETTTVKAVNRQCSSGLEAVMEIANAIRVGQIDLGIGGGVESMSQASLASAFDPKKLSPKVYENKFAKDVATINMGITSENVAERYGITREKQDQMAVESHQKAAKAMDLLKKEITPYKTMIKDKDGKLTEIIVDKDDGVRAETNLEGLAKLKPAFKQGGSTTAGNASQVSDGAACVMLTRRSIAKKMGLHIHGRIVSYACAGVSPDEMGIGPAFAIPVALKKAGLKIEDIDIYEINEAFASQATYTIEKLNIPRSKLNPKGGAIALGHPVGMTGSRQIVTLFHELHRTNKRYGVVSMCMGTGMGACAVFEMEQQLNKEIVTSLSNGLPPGIFQPLPNASYLEYRTIDFGLQWNQLLVTSLQLGLDKKTNSLVSQSFTEQADQAFYNLKNLCSGFDLKEHCLMIRIYLVNMEDYDKVNEIYLKHMSQDCNYCNPATRTIVVVKGLPKGALFGIEAVMLQ